MSLRETVSDIIKNGRITVLGIGVSNLPLINLLLEKGANVTARDKKSFDELLPISKELREKGVSLILGEDYLENIDEDLIFRAPGIRPDLSQIEKAVSCGSILTSEMELFLELTPATVIGITGSDGKTTTTTLTYKILEAELSSSGKGRVWVGGNIGTPLLDKASEMTERDFAVVELSSFQLQTATKSPSVSAITNITPNHLNWHTDMGEYTCAKCNVFQHGARRLVLNLENEATRNIAKSIFDSKLFNSSNITLFSSKAGSYDEFSSVIDGVCAVYERDGRIIYHNGECENEIIKTSDILLPGRHNVENYMTAIALTYGYVSSEAVQKIAKTFGGVEHRLELVRVFDGVKYYNSSIDSSPTRTAAALSALDERPIVICGGYDKNIPFEPLADALCKRAKKVILTGATANKIREALLSCPEYSEERLPISMCSDFREAIEVAKDLAGEGDTVLLSPACASFDAFKNFEERGNTFKAIVNSF